MSPLQVIALGLAAVAIYSAIKDTNPLEVIKSTLQGKKPPDSGSWSPAQSESPVYTIGSQIAAGLSLGTQGVTGIPSGPSGKRVWPTKSHSITQRYGVKNDRYVSGYHTGVDIDGQCGDPIWAAQAGRVVSAGYNGAYGLQVKVNIDAVTQVWYNHFSGIASGIRPGKQVAAGTPLGKMGSTGQSTGCHLHFEVRVRGDDVNPMPYLGGG